MVVVFIITWFNLIHIKITCLNAHSIFKKYLFGGKEVILLKCEKKNVSSCSILLIISCSPWEGCYNDMHWDRSQECWIHPPISPHLLMQTQYFWPWGTEARKEPNLKASPAVSFLKLSRFSHLLHLFSGRNFLCAFRPQAPPYPAFIVWLGPSPDSGRFSLLKASYLFSICF